MCSLCSCTVLACCITFCSLIVFSVCRQQMSCLYFNIVMLLFIALRAYLYYNIKITEWCIVLNGKVNCFPGGGNALMKKDAQLPSLDEKAPAMTTAVVPSDAMEDYFKAGNTYGDDSAGLSIGSIRMDAVVRSR